MERILNDLPAGAGEVRDAAPAGAMSILVVEAAGTEPSPTARFLSVSRPQYVVECATNATEALTRLEQSCFDLVVMDRHLAGTTAFSGARPPIVLLDDAVTPEGRAEARRLGAMDLLPRSAEGMEQVFRTTDRLSEIRHLNERQHLLLKHLYGEATTGPCSTGGTHRR